MIQKLKKLWSDKSERNLIINILLAFAIRGIALIISVFSMPLYIKYFNNDAVLGMWYTILSLQSWISVCDIGLGNGLRNKLTEALAKDEGGVVKKYISSTYASVTAIILPILAVGLLVFRVIDLNAFFDVSEAVIDRKTLYTALAITFGGMCTSFVLKLVNNIIYALQKASVNNAIAIISSIIPLVYIAIFPGASIGKNLIYLSLVHAIAVNAPLLVATVVVFMGKSLKGCIPSLFHVDRKTIKEMLGLGGQFFLAQIFFMILMSTNELMITRMFSSADVVEYSIYYKLFTVVGSLFMIALTPIWSKVTQDYAQKKYRKIRATNHFLYVIALLAIVAEFAILPLLQWIVNLWLGESAIVVNIKIAMVFAAYGGLYILNIVLTTVANGIGKLQSQNIFYGIGVALKIPLTLLLKHWLGGWVVVVLYTTVVLLTFCLYQLFWIEKNINRLVRESEAQNLKA